MIGKYLHIVVLLFLGFVFSCIGTATFFLIGKPILDGAKASTNWPTTPGKIIESELQRHRDDEGDTTYSAYVLYTYALDGADLESDRVWFGGSYSSSSRSDMQATVSKYPVGTEVAVHYNPDDPAESVLEPGAFASSYTAYGIGLAFMGVGGVLLLGFVVSIIFAFRGRRQSHTFAAGSDEDDERPLDEYKYRNPLDGDHSL